MTGRIRIIGGQWRRRLLPVLDAPGLRPTIDRVRETLFNWLGQDLTGQRCLDMFAGSGALGFEAASRGAAHVLMLERSPQIAQQLRLNCQTLQANTVEIITTDALKYATHLSPQNFDLIFLDPPFHDGIFTHALDISLPLLRPDGIIYTESATEISPPKGYELFRQGRAGQTYYGLIQANKLLSEAV